MHSAELIKEIHQALQNLAPQNLVLLGGGYLYGEANEDSDVDFYCLCPWWRLFFLKRYKQKITDLKKSFPEINFSVMLVPHLLERFGYYIYGRDLKGAVHTWPLPLPALIKNCLKLAYYNYLKYLVLAEDKDRNLAKTVKQLAVATLAGQGKIDFTKPIFSWQYINSHLEEPATPDTNIGINLTRFYHQFLPHFTFSWSNYLIYNIKFLSRGNPLFLFKNPDKMIVHRIVAGIQQNNNPQEFLKEIKQIVFPVIIF